MFSIRKPGIMLLVGVGMLAGCQLQMQPRPASNGDLSSTPITTDQAMKMRQWDASPSNYANDTVMAYPFYSPFQATSLCYRARLNAFTEPVLFLLNDFYLPVGVFIDFPWELQPNKSISAPPSYTLMPTLPDGPEPVPVY
jgi:hypothetical protein